MSDNICERHLLAHSKCSTGVSEHDQMHGLGVCKGWELKKGFRGQAAEVLLQRHMNTKWKGT